jgi:hypothetical protein
MGRMAVPIQPPPKALSARPHALRTLEAGLGDLDDLTAVIEGSGRAFEGLLERAEGREVRASDDAAGEEMRAWNDLRSWSRRRLGDCCSGEAACSSGGTASTLGRLPFRRCGRVFSGLALPVGMTYSEPGSRLHGLGDPAEELCATAVHVVGAVSR